MNSLARSAGNLTLSTPQGTLVLRPERGGASEEAFLYLLFSSNKGPELRGLPFGEREFEFLMQMQFRSMLASYRRAFPRARFEIVELDRWPIGRIVTDVQERCVYYVDISLMPEAQSSGIGTALMDAMLDEPRRLGLPARLKALSYNFRALQFYKRLGFVKIGDEAPHFLLEWRARR